MEFLGGDVFWGSIFGQLVGTIVWYQIVVEDEEGSYVFLLVDEIIIYILQVKVRE